jgi:branched-chain amino acid transport system substrate-binding protein
MRHARSLVLAVLVVTALAGPFACTKDDNVIVIGEVGSMTGQEATFGQSTHKGILLAAEQINQKGGIKGKKVRVRSIDDQGKPEEAVAAITALITRDKVTAVLGEVASKISLQMAPKAQQLKVPMISPSSTNVRVTQVGDYVFRVCFIDPFQGEVMARFAKENLGLERVAVLRDVASDYSTGLADAFTKTYGTLGGKVILDESYHKGDVDFRAQLTKIKGEAPQAIFVPGYYNDVGLIARQAKEMGIEVPLLGGDGWDSEKLYEVGGKALEGSYFSNHYSVDDPSPRIKAFVDAYKAKFEGQVPDGLAAMGYDAMGVLADALQRAPDTSGNVLRDAIAATKNFEGVTGNISIDANRNALKPAVVLKIAVGGKYEFVQRVQP